MTSIRLQHSPRLSIWRRGCKSEGEVTTAPTTPSIGGQRTIATAFKVEQKSTPPASQQSLKHKQHPPSNSEKKYAPPSLTPKLPTSGTGTWLDRQLLHVYGAGKAGEDEEGDEEKEEDEENDSSSTSPYFSQAKRQRIGVRGSTGGKASSSSATSSASSSQSAGRFCMKCGRTIGCCSILLPTIDQQGDRAERNCATRQGCADQAADDDEDE